MNSNSRLRILLLGYLVRGPLGGLAWHHLQYLIGLARLGHDVFFLEQGEAEYPSCYDPRTNQLTHDPGFGLEFADNAFRKIGHEDRWAFYDPARKKWHGPCGGQIRDLTRSADIVLNLSVVNPLKPWFAEIPVRVLVDTDPAFVQIRHLTDPAARALAEQHNVFLTFGENVGDASFAVPDDGFPWQPTRQPIVLDLWPVTEGRPNAPFTTVMVWESYRSKVFGGVRYGMKSDSFPDYVDLPARTGASFELAAGGVVPARELQENGWTVRDPRIPAADPWTYQNYIQNSAAEFTVAKHGYVVSRSGWFSERSAAYLASGRPVITQETGFSRWLCTGEGVFAFSDLEQAVEAVNEVRAHYDFHCRAARAVAESYFDSDQVLTQLLERVLR